MAVAIKVSKGNFYIKDLEFSIYRCGLVFDDLGIRKKRVFCHEQAERES